MEITVKDSNKGNVATVDDNFRLHVDSIQRSQIEQACLIGNAYNISTGSITLTSANESVLFYLKSNNEFPLVIKEILVIPAGSTGGTGNALVRIYKNPTGGTIVSNAVDVGTNANRTFSSAKQLDGDYFKGVEGDTITGGVSFAVSSRSTFDAPIAFDAAPIVLEKGNTLAVSWQPPTGNTSQNVVVACTLFLEESQFNGN